MQAWTLIIVNPFSVVFSPGHVKYYFAWQMQAMDCTLNVTWTLISVDSGYIKDKKIKKIARQNIDP